MPLANMFLHLTYEELQLMLRNLDSKLVVSSHIERFIIYATIISKNENKKINIKYIQSQSQQSFYHCNRAIKKLIENGWIYESIDINDKRNINLLPTKKSIHLVRAYEDSKANSLIQKGVNLPKPKHNITIKDMLQASEFQLKKIKEDLSKS